MNKKHGELIRDLEVLSRTVASIEEGRCRKCKVIVPVEAILEHTCQRALEAEIEASVQSVTWLGHVFEITVSMALSEDQTAVFTIERTKPQLLGLFKVMRWPLPPVFAPDCDRIHEQLETALREEPRGPRSFLGVTSQTLREITS